MRLFVTSEDESEDMYEDDGGTVPDDEVDRDGDNDIVGDGRETLMSHKNWLTQPKALNYKEDDQDNKGKIMYYEGTMFQ